MRELFINRLETLGYVVSQVDFQLLDFVTKKVEKDIGNQCNTSTVPEGLAYVAVERMCGEFLFTKHQCGTLTGFDFERAVKTVTMGDTSVTFADGHTPEARFEEMVDRFLVTGEEEISCYRKIKW